MFRFFILSIVSSCLLALDARISHASIQREVFVKDIKSLIEQNTAKSTDALLDFLKTETGSNRLLLVTYLPLKKTKTTKDKKKIKNKLIDLLHNDKDPTIRQYSIEGLVQMMKLKQGQVRNMDMVYDVFKAFKYALIRESNPSIKSMIAVSLGKLDFKAQELATFLISRFQYEKEMSVKGSFIEAFSHMKYSSKVAVDFLVDNLRDNILVEQTELSLKAMNVRDKRLNFILINRIKKESVDLKINSIETLGFVGEGNKAVFNFLLSFLNHKSYSLNKAAIRALGNLKANTNEVKQALIPLLSNKKLRVVSAEALSQMRFDQPSVRLKNLLDHLKDKDDAFRFAIFKNLKNNNFLNPPVDQLVRFYKRENQFRSKEVIIKIIGELKSSSKVIRYVQALSHREKNPTLKEQLKNTLYAFHNKASGNQASIGFDLPKSDFKSSTSRTSTKVQGLNKARKR